MIDPKKIDDLVKQLGEAVPTELKEVEQEVRKQFKGILESGLRRLDLVSREEFDIQKKVLLKTRQKLEQLEQQLSELEQQNKS